jgi:hypothetical protein
LCTTSLTSARTTAKDCADGGQEEAATLGVVLAVLLEEAVESVEPVEEERETK